MWKTEWIELLGCPVCGGEELRLDGRPDGGRVRDGALRCASCHSGFPVKGGVPELKPRPAASDGAWATWTRHLKRLDERRRVRTGVSATAQDERWGRKLEAFSAFVQRTLPAGRILDVGCGPGSLRRYVGGRVEYFGVDPMTLPESAEFPFLSAVAEALPFRDGTFSSLVVRSALDHFCDLDAFFREAARVLTPDGALYLEQVVQGSGGVTGTVQHLAHLAKDLLDDFQTRRASGSAPKHMREFSHSSLVESLAPHFQVEAVRTYRSRWYMPTQMFIQLRLSEAAGTRLDASRVA